MVALLAKKSAAISVCENSFSNSLDSKLLDHKLSETNLVNIQTTYFWRIYLDNILPSMPLSHKLSLSFRFSGVILKEKLTSMYIFLADPGGRAF
jgi:hypothetical protein